MSTVCHKVIMSDTLTDRAVDRNESALIAQILKMFFMRGGKGQTDGVITCGINLQRVLYFLIHLCLASDRIAH